MALPAEDQLGAIRRPWTPPPQTLAPAATPAPQQAQAMQQQTGIGGPGWDQPFDQAWAKRAMKKLGLTLEDLQDPATRKWANRQMQQQRTGTPAATTPTATTPATPTATPAVPAKGAGPAINPAVLVGRPGGNMPQTPQNREAPGIWGQRPDPGQGGPWGNVPQPRTPDPLWGQRPDPGQGGPGGNMPDPNDPLKKRQNPTSTGLPDYTTNAGGF